jgi:hypothetical protein
MENFGEKIIPNETLKENTEFHCQENNRRETPLQDSAVSFIAFYFEKMDYSLWIRAALQLSLARNRLPPNYKR